MISDPERALERQYMLRPKRLATYVACEDWNLVWDIKEVREIERMWKCGESLEVIGQRFKRDLDEVAILLMDRVRRGTLKPRVGGVFGDA